MRHPPWGVAAAAAPRCPGRLLRAAPPSGGCGAQQPGLSCSSVARQSKRPHAHTDHCVIVAVLMRLDQRRTYTGPTPCPKPFQRRPHTGRLPLSHPRSTVAAPARNAATLSGFVRRRPGRYRTDRRTTHRAQGISPGLSCVRRRRPRAHPSCSSHQAATMAAPTSSRQPSSRASSKPSPVPRTVSLVNGEGASRPTLPKRSGSCPAASSSPPGQKACPRSRASSRATESRTRVASRTRP